MAAKLKYRGRKNTKRRHVVGYFTVAILQDDSACFIGASTKKKLRQFWQQLSSSPIDESKICRCRLFNDR